MHDFLARTENQKKKQFVSRVPVGHIWKFDLEKSRKHLILE